MDVKNKKMPVRFKNISSSGQAKFMNVAGLGQARFYIPPPEYVTLTIYAKQSGITQDVDLHFSTDGGTTWDFAGATFNSSTCAQIYSDANILRFSSLMFRFGSPTDINVVYRHNATFTAEETCPTFIDFGGGENAAICERTVSTNNNRRYNCTLNPQDSTGCPDPATTTSTTTTTTTEFINYNYYTLTPCSGGGGTDYRSILALGLNDIISFTDNPTNNACYQVTDINASPNTNDLPTVYGRTGCGGSDCIQV